jgi:hypothetical protein
MAMDDDDFMGDIEFNLSPEQSEIVSRAIELAAQEKDHFRFTNPLISIMQWWQSHVPEVEKRRGSPEGTLAEACRLYVQWHDKPEQWR